MVRRKGGTIPWNERTNERRNERPVVVGLQSRMRRIRGRRKRGLAISARSQTGDFTVMRPNDETATDRLAVATPIVLHIRGRYISATVKIAKRFPRIGWLGDVEQYKSCKL